tara:strand:- start:323 stop:913 length:591 start_codon:yes stop_codon:yes gene_type:complete
MFVFIKKIFLILVLFSSTNLFSQNEDYGLNINLGLYICEKELAEYVPKDENYGFLCSFRNDMRDMIEITTVVLEPDVYLENHEEECIKRISTVEPIVNLIEGTPVSEGYIFSATEDTWMWGYDGFLQGFFDRTEFWQSESHKRKIEFMKNKLLFHVNVIDKGMFDEDEDTRSITMCFWEYGWGISNLQILNPLGNY